MIIGHRGAMGSAPENTEISFQKALDNGADGVEFDVHLTQDDEIVVIHDESIDRTADGNGTIKELTLQELKGFDFGRHYGKEFTGQKILTLVETLELVKRSRIINVELKNGPIYYPGLEEKVVSVVKNMGLEDKVIISSFNHYSIKKVKEIDREIKCGILYMAGLYQPWNYAKQLGVEAIHPYFAGALPEIIKGCQEKGIMVNVFGANKEDIIERLINLGVDGIITDYPAKAMELRDKNKDIL